MASPTVANVLADVSATIAYQKAVAAALASASSTWDTAVEGLSGDRQIDTVANAMARIRGVANGAIVSEAWRPVVLSFLLDAAHAAGIPESAIAGNDLAWMLYRLKKYMHDNSLSFKERNITVGAQNPSPSSGAGPILRLATDEWGYPLEDVHIETKTWRCLRDKGMGVFAGEEVFEVLGGNPERWPDVYSGSGMREEVACTSCRTGGILANPSFDAVHGTTDTAADKVPGWTITGTPANITRNTAFYKKAPGVSDANSACLEFETDCTIVQYLETRRRRLDLAVPYLPVIGYKKTNSGATGSLILSIGSNDTTLDLSTISDTDWHFLYPTLDEDLYMRNWNEPDVALAIQVSSLSAGSIYVDDVVFAPMRRFDGQGGGYLGEGHWWMAVGGETPHDAGDTFTFATTLAGSEAVIQYWMWRWGFGSFPNAASPSQADP